MKKKYFILLIIPTMLLLYLFIINDSTDYSSNTIKNAPKLDYIDIDHSVLLRNATRKINIVFFEGHTNEYTDVLFRDLKPYKDLNIYLKDERLIIIYNEVNEGEKNKRFIRIDGRGGEMKKDELQVYINGKLSKDIQVSIAIE